MTADTERLDNVSLTDYPDYVPGQPPDVYRLRQYAYLDEYESIWGRPWGAPGIGPLREVGLVKPTSYEGHPLWAEDPNFFLLRYRPNIDVGALVDNHAEYAELLGREGVNIQWMEFEDTWGAYGPMRKLFVCEEIRVVRGGAILPRFGHASYKRGLEREFQRFLSSIGCPILYQVHGSGICEVGPMFVAMAEDVFVAGVSCGANREGLEQVIPVMERSGVQDIHVMELPTIMETFSAGGEFHVDMVISPVDLRVALVYPGNLSWETYVWLRDKGFKLIEVPQDEQRFCPTNLILLEPGRVIMPAQAVETVKAVRSAGVDVIEFDSSGIMQGGVNGLKCITMELLRDTGPSLDD